MWVNQLWPFAKEQDGVFVQLQAVVPPPPDGGEAAAGQLKPGKSRAAAARSSGAKASDAGRGTDQAGTEPQLGKLWFLRLGERIDGAGWRSRAPAEIPYDLSLLPAILRR